MERRRVCLGCRTLLADGETCGAPRGHEVVALDQPAQRARLDDEVWGPDSRARKLRRAAKAGAGGGLLGGLLDGCGGCDAAQGLEGCGELAGAGEGLLAVLFVIVAAVVAAILTVVVVWGVTALVKWLRDRADRPKPHGALRKPPAARGRSNGAGTVTAGARIAVPWKEGGCLAYAFELHTKTAFGGDALLRDARTAGFDLTLDDGRQVRVPPGRVTLVGKLDEADVDRARVDGFLAGVDPLREERSSLFPYDYARAFALEPGARVDVLGDLEMSADGSQGHGYRASAGMLVPVGVPVLRLKRPADDFAHLRISTGPDGTAAAEAEAEAEAQEEQVDSTSSSDLRRARRREPGP